MSLLLVDQKPEFQKLTNEVYRRQLEQDPRLLQELDDKAKDDMMQDVRYNVDFLYSALRLNDANLYGSYARWLYQLLCALMTYCTRERICDMMVHHYELVRTCMKDTLSTEDQAKLDPIMDAALQATRDECACASPAYQASPRYQEERQRYLDCLLRADSKGALAAMADFVRSNIPLNDIYVDIVSETMRTVGDMWHRNQISVDTEHCCTSITQMALAQLFPLVFEQKRRNRTVVVACVGSELHELGARMVADMFEYRGWDSVYLGAAVPTEAIESAIETHKPQLVALSVTMPQHLPLCEDAVARLRENCPQVKIAVGGNAFSHTNAWKSWGVDAHTDDARDLVAWADGALG